MTRNEAIRKANKFAKLRDEPMFVVFESGEYHIASEIALDTFFMEISDRNILYCTADGEL